MSNKNIDKKEVIYQTVDRVLKLEREAANQVVEVSKAEMVSEICDIFEEVFARNEN